MGFIVWAIIVFVQKGYKVCFVWDIVQFSFYLISSNGFVGSITFVREEEIVHCYKEIEILVY